MKGWQSIDIILWIAVVLSITGAASVFVFELNKPLPDYDIKLDYVPPNE